MAEMQHQHQHQHQQQGEVSKNADTKHTNLTLLATDYDFPTSVAPTPGPRLKIRIRQVPSDQQSQSCALTETDHPRLPSILHKWQEAEGEGLPLTTHRRGRQGKKRKRIENHVSADDVDQAMPVAGIRKKRGSDASRTGSSGRPSITIKNEVSACQSLLPERNSRRGPWAYSLLYSHDEEMEGEAGRERSPQVAAPQALDVKHVEHAPRLEIHSDVHKIMNSLRSRLDVVIELPALSSETDPNVEQAYSGKFLVDLYILCYENQRWNLCDLITDTWIRAFHAMRTKGFHDSRYQLWRRNAALERRQRAAEAQERARAQRQGSRKAACVKGVGYDEQAPDYGLEAEDPELGSDVTDFDPTLLYHLHLYTRKDCGARLLWADAMALGGDKAEKMMHQRARRGHTWHADLIANIMDSSLRMVRRKLTLKIEEACEGTWCKRYHEHLKHGLPCYRELAWKHEMESEKNKRRSVASPPVEGANRERERECKGEEVGEGVGEVGEGGEREEEEEEEDDDDDDDEQHHSSECVTTGGGETNTTECHQDMDVESEDDT